ncbi:anthranilate synthase component I [Lebetimonas natsushimae]|uniref:Anthranilate synthase component 1 n=1 Tax=Lebetimonas natsushimae TaxID=1936991 RepID=A0A292YGP8_9BACT|nr:anthranilate synthase component I family protein [Lebetimonas natsushimae]GAX88181.1 anthranilate synthase component I [Lebetimonas natsushimae]
MKHTKFLLDEFSAVAIYNQISSLFPNEKKFLLESVINNDNGNYSFIFIGEKERIVYKNKKTVYETDEKKEIFNTDPFSFLKKYYKNLDKDYYKKLVKELNIGFVDGFIGYIAYDMVGVFEPVLQKNMENLKDETDIPDFYMIRPKIVIGYSHKTSEITIIINDEKLNNYLYIIKDLLTSSYKHLPLKPINVLEEPHFLFDKEKFFEIVENAKENIKAGDIFQIVLSNRLYLKAKIDKFSFYRKLRSKNPSPYLYFLDFNEFSIIGSSPEVMVRLTDDVILLRPIAGTRKRGKDLKEDIEMENDMLNDPKEKAEHVMLVDLGRNDVGRVSRGGSVEVEDFMRVERYSHVMHLVSDVIGLKKENIDMFDVFKATFPAGTVSGAPKIKAMELIANYEGVKRSFYAGSIGYFGFDGNMDSAITIRTALIKKDNIIFQAGAGIVADSKPELEFKEINNKLGALVSTLKELSK